jgi:hypothetical protein
MSYSGVTTIKGKKCIWLQGIGYVRAKPIESFKKGDLIAYNYGYTGKVVSIKKATPKFFDVTVISEGKKYTSRVKKGSYKPYFKK